MRIAVQIALVLAWLGVVISGMLLLLSLPAACTDMSYPYEGYGRRPTPPAEWLRSMLELAFAFCACWLAAWLIKNRPAPPDRALALALCFAAYAVMIALLVRGPF